MRGEIFIDKKSIPYTVENSFFYIKGDLDAESLPFITIAPKKTNLDSEKANNVKPADHSDFLREFGKGIQKLKKYKKAK